MYWYTDADIHNALWVYMKEKRAARVPHAHLCRQQQQRAAQQTFVLDDALAVSLTFLIPHAPLFCTHHSRNALIYRLLDSLHHLSWYSYFWIAFLIVIWIAFLIVIWIAFLIVIWIAFLIVIWILDFPFSFWLHVQFTTITIYRNKLNLLAPHFFPLS